MVISKTKYEASEAEIKALFAFHKMGNAVDIAALGNGGEPVELLACEGGHPGELRQPVGLVPQLAVVLRGLELESGNYVCHCLRILCLV